MDNLPMIQDKLNIFQKLRIKMFLMRKYSCSRFENAPEYMKQDERIIKMRIQHALKNEDKNEITELVEKSITTLNQEEKTELLKMLLTDKFTDSEVANLCEFLSKDDINIILQNREFDNIGYINKLLKYASMETIKKLMQLRKQQQWAIPKPSIDISLASLDSQIELIKEDEDIFLTTSAEAQAEYITKYNPKLITKVAEKVQLQILQENNDMFELITNTDVKRVFLERNIKYLLAHPKLIKLVSKELQLKIASENKEMLKFLDKNIQIELIEKWPNAFEYANISAQKKIFTYEEYFPIVKLLINKDKNYYKYVPTFLRKLIVRDLIGRVTEMETEEIMDLFVKRDLRT